MKLPRLALGPRTKLVVLPMNSSSIEVRVYTPMMDSSMNTTGTGAVVTQKSTTVMLELAQDPEEVFKAKT